MTLQTPRKPPVQPEALRSEVRSKYREVATDPGREHHFHTGRFLAEKLGYEAGEERARSYEVYGYPFLARKPE